ncbi:MAG: hypothetical protein NT027_20320 [Proteobacteria bacterium]|nr:hypothetical protein [Pseudomonadota bacterium]
MKIASHLLQQLHGFWKSVGEDVYYFFFEDKVALISQKSQPFAGEFDYIVEPLNKDHPDSEFDRLIFRDENCRQIMVYFKIVGHRLTLIEGSGKGKKYSKVTDLNLAPKLPPRSPKIKVDIPGVGTVTADRNTGDFVSEPLAVLGMQKSKIRFEKMDPLVNLTEYAKVALNFLNSASSTLKMCVPFIYNYYRDVLESSDDDEKVKIRDPDTVFQYVQFNEISILRRKQDGLLYVLICCDCDWEMEHGLQIVLKGGKDVTMVGRYSGHLSNADAYGDKKLENIVYRKSD